MGVGVGWGRGRWAWYRRVGGQGEACAGARMSVQYDLRSSYLGRGARARRAPVIELYVAVLEVVHVRVHGALEGSTRTPRGELQHPVRAPQPSPVVGQVKVTTAVARARDYGAVPPLGAPPSVAGEARVGGRQRPPDWPGGGTGRCRERGRGLLSTSGPTGRCSK